MKMNYPENVAQTLSNDFFCRNSVNACFTMAHDEMGLVTQRPDKLIRQNASKLRFDAVF